MDMANLKIADTAHYNGGIYAFCSKGCKESFLKDPAKYSAQ
jgi:YHS domain-containing protein